MERPALSREEKRCSWKE